MPKGIFLVGYTYDIAAIITTINTEEAQQKLRRVMLRIKTWLDSHGLDLAMHKTELITADHRMSYSLACGLEHCKRGN